MAAWLQEPRVDKPNTGQISFLYHINGTSAVGTTGYVWLTFWRTQFIKQKQQNKDQHTCKDVFHTFHNQRMFFFLPHQTHVHYSPASQLSRAHHPVDKIFHIVLFFFLFFSSFKEAFHAATSIQSLHGCSSEGFKGQRKAERAGWVRGLKFAHRVEDCIFTKKTVAAIWVEVMDISLHGDRIGGSIGGERPLKTKWTKSSWFECSSAHTLPKVL